MTKSDILLIIASRKDFYVNSDGLNIGGKSWYKPFRVTKAWKKGIHKPIGEMDMPENNNTNPSESEAVNDISQTPKSLTFEVASRAEGKVIKGQWTLVVTEVAPGLFDFEGFNLDPDTGMKKFLKFGNTGTSGMIFIDPEPSLAMPLDELGLDFKLTGCIMLNRDGSTFKRFSLSKMTFIDGVKVSFNQKTRELYFDGEPTGFRLRLLIRKDKNRIGGSDGYFTPIEETESEIIEAEVKVEEMELEDAATCTLEKMGFIKIE